MSDPKVIWLPMPQGTGTVEVTIMIDDELEEEPFLLELVTVTEDGLPIAPDVQGVHELTVYIDGKLWHKMTYDFDTGEQLP